MPKVKRGRDGEVISVNGVFNYQQQDIPRSLVANGTIVTRRDGSGSDAELKGAIWAPTEVSVMNARSAGPMALDTQGFELKVSPTSLSYSQFYEEGVILRRYYPECASLVKSVTGATLVAPFDHNLRSASGKQASKTIQGGSVVQSPAALVHGDYTLTSGPRRLEQLSKPPKANDTLGKILGGAAVMSKEDLEMARRGRFSIINVWRSIRDEPAKAFPLACCDASTVSAHDLCVFEIHYADRIGENYFAAHTDQHRWYYYPSMLRDEAMLIKQWDSDGTLVGGSKSPFALHSAFDDPATPADAQDRESIEVRCVCIFEATSSEAR